MALYRKSNHKHVQGLDTTTKKRRIRALSQLRRTVTYISKARDKVQYELSVSQAEITLEKNRLSTYLKKPRNGERKKQFLRENARIRRFWGPSGSKIGKLGTKIERVPKKKLARWRDKTFTFTKATGRPIYRGVGLIRTVLIRTIGLIRTTFWEKAWNYFLS